MHFRHFDPTRPASIPDTSTSHQLLRWLGSVAIERRTCDREVAGSTPTAALFGQQPWASCSHLMCFCFTKQYNLVPCEGLHAKAPYCGSGIGSNEQGRYCRAVLKRFCRMSNCKEPWHKSSTLLYFYFLRLYNVWGPLYASFHLRLLYR